MGHSSQPRIVHGLRWAAPCENPWPRSRPRGAKAHGLRFERLVARALPAALHNPWFEFEDANGPGRCSPDFILKLAPGHLVILECKYTDCEEAKAQLEQLYRPVVQLIMPEARISTAVVVRHLLPSSYPIVQSVAEAVASGRSAIVQWLGRGPFPLGVQ